MSSRSAARFLAPIALVAVIVVVIVIVSGSKVGSTGASRATDRPSSSATTTRRAPRRRRHRRGAARSYAIKRGDSLSVIASKTGVPLAKIVRSNPGIQTRTLQPGERIKLGR